MGECALGFGTRKVKRTNATHLLAKDGFEFHTARDGSVLRVVAVELAAEAVVCRP